MKPSRKAAAIKGLKIGYRLICCFGFTVLCHLATWFLVGKAVSYGYRHYYSIADHVDLSDDFGLGLIGFLVAGIASLVSIPFAIYWGWRLSGPRR